MAVDKKKASLEKERSFSFKVLTLYRKKRIIEKVCWGETDEKK